MPMIPRRRRGHEPSDEPGHSAGTPRIDVMEGAGMRWLHIDDPTPIEMSALAEQFEFHPLDFEDCLSKRQRPKVDEYDSYLFVVLHFPIYDKRIHRLATAELDLFIGEDYLVTVTANRLRPVTDLRAAIDESTDDRDLLFKQGPGYLLYTILSELFAYCFPILDKIGTKLDDIEDGIFSGHTKLMVEEISNVKQEIIAYRRIVKPMLTTMRVLEMKTATRYIPDSLDVYFDDVIDAAERVSDMLESYKEVAEALEDTNEAILQHRLNDILLVLTMLSVIFLPLTLIAGIYGMNVELPFDNAASAFWLLMGIMVATGGSMLAFFKWRKWF